MNNKGYTLLEVLGTLILLSILGSISTFIVYSLIKDSRRTVCENQIASIIDAAKQYQVDNKIFLDDDSEEYINVEELNGYISLENLDKYKSLKLKVSKKGNLYDYVVYNSDDEEYHCK